MAEFALGLTKTAVAGTVSRVKSAIEEEADIKERVQEDLEFITSEFEMMQSFLRGANTAVRAAKNQVVRTWVKQLRDLAFDVEDCVDFIVHLDSPPWTNWLWRVVPSCCKAGAPPLPMDEAVAEIKRLKTRVQDASQRNRRYNLMIDSTPAMADQHIMLPPPTTTTTSPSSTAAFNILSEVWQAAGKLHSTGTSLKDLTSAEGNELQVVSLWPGDLHLSEVSCLIMEAYNDPDIYSKFECRAWVKLTTAAFSIQEFLNSLIAQFCPNFSTGHLAAQDSKAELTELVNTKTYLLVIQGISTVVEWYAIKMYLPDRNNGSRIIVSTQQLRTALLCTGDPYKVSELARFSDGQSLCAFSKASVLRKDIGELTWQIRRGGVISMLGVLNDRFIIRYNIHKLYKLLMYKHKDLDGVLVFKEQSWVDVPDPFNLENFWVRLFLNFQSGDFAAKEIAAVGLEGVAERCRKYLVEGDCLVVINGLQSEEHWDMIKETLVLSGEPMAKGNSIVVITKEASVAAHCADQQNRCLKNIDVEWDMALNRFIQDKRSCGIGGKEDSRRARLLFHDPSDKYNWIYNFQLLGREDEVSTLERQIEKPGVITVWGHPGVGKSAIVKKVYYKQMYKSDESRNENAEVFADFIWVDVPDRPFDLIDFSWHLLLGFYSRDVTAKEHEAVAMLRGQNPIQDCCRILRQKKCLVVIDGLQSERDWEEIKATFLSSEPTTLQGCIVVITDKHRVARHCVVDEEEGRVLHVKRLRAIHRPLTKAPPGRRNETGGEAGGWATEFNLVGRDQEKGELKFNLHLGHFLFSVWGVAGVGKSSLVRDVYRTFQNNGIFIKYSWVDVPDPFDLGEFSQRLLLGFHSNDLQAKEIAAVSIMEGHDSIHASCKIMRENRCLIVFDGLRSTHDWDLIRAAFVSDTNKGHSIIVITNEASIAMHCVHDKTGVLNVKGLNATDALRLFRKIALCGKKRLSPDEKEFLEPIVAKCGGLPEVIAAIGEYIAKEIAWMGITGETLRSISQEVHHDFMGKLETDSRFQSLRGLFCWMQSYFDACPDSLKPCIFYLSVFPLGHNIRRRRLLSRWIAEGYSTDASPGVTKEENGEMLFAELVKLSIIQEQQQTPSNSSNNKKKIVIQVNGFYHGYIISRPMEDNLVFALEDRCSINSQRAGQHLTIKSSWDRDEVVYKSIDFTRLRSLTVFGEWKPFFISTDINMRLLRVLDLEDTTSGVKDDVLEQIGKLLPRLKFLSLRGCKEITRIPDSFGGLRQLQTLDVTNTRIVALPYVIIKLVKLQYIHAGNTHEKLDVADVDLPTSDDDDCTSASSEDRSTAMEGDDGTIPSVAIPRVDADGLTKSQPLPTGPADGDEMRKRQIAAAADGDCKNTNLPETADGDDTSTSQPTTEDGDDTSKGQPAAADGGGTRTSLPETMDSGDSSTNQPAGEDGDSTWQPTQVVVPEPNSDDTRQPTTVAGDDRICTSQPTKADNDGTSEPAAVADCDDTRQPAWAADGIVISTSRTTSADHGMSTRQQPVAAVGVAGTSASQQSVAAEDDCMIISQPAIADGDDTSRRQTAADEDRASATQAPWMSWLSKKKSRDNIDRNGGVEIPASAIGKLTALHTLGVINVSGARGKAVLKELQKLTQLRKLRVSGISRKNLHDLCSAISAHSHLESFSVRLDKDEDAESFFSSSDDMFSNLPKTIKSLKLYTAGGHATVQVSPVLVKQLRNLIKVNFQLKISTQEDIENLVELPNKDAFRLVCLKPTQGGQLRYGWWGTHNYSKYLRRVQVLKIDCGGSNSAIVFGPMIPNFVEALVIQCSSAESSLELCALENLRRLKEVTLKGSYSEAVKQRLQQLVSEHPNKPVWKLE